MIELTGLTAIAAIIAAVLVGGFTVVTLAAILDTVTRSAARANRWQRAHRQRLAWNRVIDPQRAW